MRISITVLILCFSFPIVTFGTTYVTTFPYELKIKKHKVRIKAIPYAPNSGSPTHGKTTVYRKNKELYTINQYFRNNLYPSKNGELIAIVNSYISRYITFSNEVNEYDDEVIIILKKGKPYLKYKLNQLLNLNYLEKEFHEPSFNWTFKNDQYGSWFNRLKDKKTEKNKIFVENNILHVITAASTIVRINLENGKKLKDLNLEDFSPIKRHFKPEKRNIKNYKTTYPEKFTLPKMENGEHFENALSRHLNMKLIDDSKDNKESLCIYVHTMLLNKEGRCELIYVNSGNENLDSKIIDWVNSKKFEIHELPSNFEKFKFKGFIYLEN